MQMLSIVVGWDLYNATRSPVVLGNVGLVQIVPVFLFTFAAGHVADRYDRRTTLLVAQSMVAAMGFVLAFSGALRGVTLIYTCLFFSGLARTFQFPGRIVAIAEGRTPGASEQRHQLEWHGP